MSITVDLHHLKQFQAIASLVPNLTSAGFWLRDTENFESDEGDEPASLQKIHSILGSANLQMVLFFFNSLVI